MGTRREKQGSLPVEVRDRLDRVSDQLAALGLALAGAEAREGICPDELRGLGLFMEEILRGVQEIQGDP